MESLVPALAIGGTLVLLLIGTPIWMAFLFGGAAVLLLDMRVPLQTMSQFAFSSVESYPLLAVPFFVMAGALLVRSGGMEPLRDLVARTIARRSAGLPALVIVLAAVLGAISGSSVACMAILAAVMLPLFQTAGLSRAYGSGIIAVTSELGLIIPPSVFLIVFGAANQVSIGDLFIGGMSSGILLALCMLPFAFPRARTRVAAANDASIAAGGQPPMAMAAFKVVPLLLFPVIILGGIYGGIMSPTESASIAVFYTLLMGVFVYRGLTLRLFGEALEETVRVTTLVYFLLFGADMLSRLFSYLRIPQTITASVLDMGLGPDAFMLVVTLFLMFLGMFFSSLPMVVVVLPLFLPTARSLGIDPVYFGTIGVICATFGGLTPPFSPQLWIAEAICKVPMGQILREALPFMLAWIIGLGLLLLFPQIVTVPVAILS